jgi:hypothetical protein
MSSLYVEMMGYDEFVRLPILMSTSYRRSEKSSGRRKCPAHCTKVNAPTEVAFSHV